MKTKFRVLQRDFAKLSNGKKVIEYEEVVVGSKSMTFEEYEIYIDDYTKKSKYPDISK